VLDQPVGEILAGFGDGGTAKPFQVLAFPEYRSLAFRAFLQVAGDAAVPEVSLMQAAASSVQQTHR
jgi:hypothetical protein